MVKVVLYFSILKEQRSEPRPLKGFFQSLPRLIKVMLGKVRHRVYEISVPLV
ncbi:MULTISPECIES: hypothetical protein [Metallosphaera]|uniref:hypothetical protein n=1 Tax=Metallosphaera TaxID=41980 RepID=UPI000A7FD629|nr:MULTISPECIES: hypothetical protein [Metallosphaera]WPX07348.1 hypothetical protein SOJ17_001110 [Metallosphaera sedula DSM 5348]BBL47192.1 hypothetical protein MJ1HA_1293 [Metallosphaera sedula]